MATVTHVGNNVSTAADPWASASFTPAVGDLLVLIGMAVGGATYGSMTITDSTGDVPTWGRAFYANAQGWIAIADTLCKTTTSRTVTAASISSETGGGFSLYRISGMTRTGTMALRQRANAAHSLGTAPSVTGLTSILSTNPVFGMVVTADTSSPIVAQPTSWTEDADGNFAVPTQGYEFCHIDSGVTGTSVTWGGTTVTAGQGFVAELDASPARLPAPIIRPPLVQAINHRSPI